MPRTSHRDCRGFTLIELLVVLLMIGIILTFAALSFHGNSAAERAHEETRRLARLVELASEEAITRGVPLGLRLEQQGYRFMVLNGQDWAPIEGDRLMRHRDLPHGLSLELYVDGLPVVLPKDKTLPSGASGSDARKPQVLFLTTGEMTPVEIRVVAEQEDAEPIRLRLSIPLLGRPKVQGDES